MDVGALGGFFGGIGAILLGQHMEGGHVGSLIQPSAAFIVIGGTLGCVFLQFSVKDIMKGVKMIMEILFKGHGVTRADMILQILRYARIARRDSIFALEKELGKVEHTFLKAILGYVVDGKGSKSLYDAADTEIENFEHDNHAPMKVFEAVGGYCPTVGILGAVLGLIHVMENLSDPSKLGGGIAVAFVATLYGVGTANLIALPLAAKIKHHVEEEVIVKKIVVKGLAMIVEGQNPTLIERELVFFLPENERKVILDAKKED